MNKHNVVVIETFVKDKETYKHEQSCFQSLDKINDEMIKMKLFIKSSKQYIENMWRYGFVKEHFANDILKQIDLILEKELSESLNK